MLIENYEDGNRLQIELFQFSLKIGDFLENLML